MLSKVARYRQLRVGWIDGDDVEWGPWLDYRIEFGNEMVLDSYRYFRQ